MARLSPKSLFDSQSIELLYHQFADALATGPGELEIDLAEVKFARPHGVLALVNIARHWYEQGKGQTVLVNLFPTLHAYLERIDLFTAGDPYLVIRQNLPAEHRLSRTTVSANLLEMLPIRGASAYVEADCLQAIERAKYILDVWFPAHQTERYRLCLMLSEIAENIKHSQDRGFAIIQRYDGRGKSSKTSEVVIAVSDLGIGIEQSLISKGLHPPLVEGIARSGATYLNFAQTNGNVCGGKYGL